MVTGSRDSKPYGDLGAVNLHLASDLHGELRSHVTDQESEY